jgi:RNA polymerase sigma-70 factor (ECF subfamily)
MKFKIFSEEELIQKALNGSETHLNLLISMYEPFIMENISKQIKNQHDLLDLRQHVCCRIAKQFIQKSYVHQDKFSNWTNCIIKNEINSYFRKKKQNAFLQYFSPEILDDYSDEYLMVAEDSLSFTPNLSFYVDRLTAEQAVVVKLKCFKDKTFREISELTKVPINTVMGRYRYGIEKIREMMVKQ